jgi:uncharacterized protein YggE
MGAHYWWLAGVACVMIAGLPAPPAVAEEQQPAAPRRSLTVTGRGEVKASPDRVVLSLAVETASARATDAAAENAKRSQEVTAAVKRLLGPDDTVATTRYAVEPRYDVAQPGQTREPRITGYVVRNEVLVESRKTEAAGAFIDAATAAGANRVSSLQFTLSTPGEALRTALERAGADARAQAESAARGLGVRLRGVVSASTVAGPVVVPRRFETMAAEARVPTPVEAGEATVTATLQVTYEIE